MKVIIQLPGVGVRKESRLTIPVISAQQVIEHPNYRVGFLTRVREGMHKREAMAKVRARVSVLQAQRDFLDRNGSMWSEEMLAIFERGERAIKKLLLGD